MSSTAREELQMALSCYTTDTLTFLDVVMRFCAMSSKWMLGRESELDMMQDIKTRADSVNPSLKHVTQSQSKGTALWQYTKSAFTPQASINSSLEELEKELGAVLQGTLQGIKELERFLDAVEKLAVTSLHVFTEENQVLHLPIGPGLDFIQAVIIAARRIYPLLVEFKRDADVFFLPRLQNMAVLSYQLDKYINTTQRMCEKMEKSSLCDLGPDMTVKPSVYLDVDLSEDEIQRMLRHINQLTDLRMDPHFRMVFLFQEDSSSAFIKEFSDRQPRMLNFLKELEESAVQLDKMNFGAKVSSVAGSSVGVVGGVLTVVGLALTPVTAGVSLALTMTGLGMGITSGVNSLITTATEVGVNKTQQKKSNSIFQSFMEDVQVLQDCLEEVTLKEINQVDLVLLAGKAAGTIPSVIKSIDSLCDAAAAFKALKNEQVIRNAARVAAQEGKAISRVASDVPDIGQAAIKGPLALSKSARAGLIAVNALFVGLDIFFICKDSITLAKGTETEFSQFIRARAALWHSEMDAWKKICDTLQGGQEKSQEYYAVLRRPFYADSESSSEEADEEHFELREEDSLHP